jgi:hypothetical protein
MWRPAGAVSRSAQLADDAFQLQFTGVPAGGGELAILVDSGHTVTDGQCGELFALAIEKRIATNHEPACPQLGQGCEDGIKVAYRVRMQNMKLQPRLRASLLSRKQVTKRQYPFPADTQTIDVTGRA